MSIMSWFAIGACNHASVPPPGLCSGTLPSLLWGRVSDEGIGVGGSIPETNGNENETCSITEYILSVEHGRVEAS